MVILEIVSVFHGRHSCLYDHSVVSDISDWYYDIFFILFRPGICYNPCCNVRGSGGRLAVSGMHYIPAWRLDFAVSWDYRSVFIEDLSGNEEKADLHNQGTGMTGSPCL